MSYLDVVLFHGQWPIDSMQFEVESARVANGLALIVATPQRRGRRGAIGAPQAQTSCRRLLETRQTYDKKEQCMIISSLFFFCQKRQEKRGNYL